MDGGARLGWLIDPHTRRVPVYRAGHAAEVLENPDTLSGENVLPGFVFAVGRPIFAATRSDPASPKTSDHLGQAARP